ncbi:MAG: bifunctional adenosylcobinamide kinase/adenosylcobinamide-phosphate guanylyltransferase [Rhizomicrobium sp.]
MGTSWLIFGGARSGKTRRGLGIAGAFARSTYIATAEARDDEMRRRIALHRAERGPSWSTVEAPLDLAATLRAADGPARGIMVDCLTLWLSNLLEAGRSVEDETRCLIETVFGLAATTVFISNEVGLGIVPDNALARSFRDAQGRLNQSMATAVSHVELMVAGLPLKLK